MPRSATLSQWEAVRRRASRAAAAAVAETTQRAARKGHSWSGSV